jgi:hypothetical protein
MLSSAHILAMDTKNLLDVCDSIRLKFEISEENEEVDTVAAKQFNIPEGIYDNQDAIQEQLKIVEEEPDSQFNSQKILSN